MKRDAPGELRGEPPGQRFPGAALRAVLDTRHFFSQADAPLICCLFFPPTVVGVEERRGGRRAGPRTHAKPLRARLTGYRGRARSVQASAPDARRPQNGGQNRYTPAAGPEGLASRPWSRDAGGPSEARELGCASRQGFKGSSRCAWTRGRRRRFEHCGGTSGSFLQTHSRKVWSCPSLLEC